MLPLILASCFLIEASVIDLDLSTLDIDNFKYFKYPTSTTAKPILLYRKGHYIWVRKIPTKPSGLSHGIAKFKSVYKYLKGVVVGNPLQKVKVKYVFDPNAGQKMSQTYQSKYGFRGEKLVEALGRGLHKL